jgi:hypothetical protein
MDNNEVIRLNIKVHPDKDPALHRLLSAISKESRARRLINLASTGMLVESSGFSLGTPSIKPTISENELVQVVSIEKPTVASVSQATSDKAVYDEEELGVIGDMFK